MALQAIIWDYDATLVDSRSKNLAVTRQIITDLTGNDAAAIPALHTLDQYIAASQRALNWRTFYTSDCGLTDAQTDQAGALWTAYQLKDHTPVQVYAGIAEVFAAFSNVPHGVVSQNSRRRIADTLREHALLQYVHCIIGYEEVDWLKQKPEPDGLLLCIEQLTGFETGTVFYIGDHETDVACAVKTNQVLRARNREIQVFSIAALYGSDADDTAWTPTPDYRAEQVLDIIRIIQAFQQKRKNQVSFEKPGF